ncbi:MAG TPA: TetR family transcriptional regulator [Capillimicrobium sp.]
MTDTAAGRRPFLTREQLDRLQRARVLDAVTAVVADRGYAEASIADVVAYGGLSRRTFYELFDNKADAFFAAYDDVVDRAIRRMETACSEDEAVEVRVRAGLAELLRLVERHPSWAQMCVLEAPAASAVTGDRARHLRPLARWVADVHRELELDVQLDPLAHTGMVLGGLQAWLLAARGNRAELLRGLYRLTIGRDSPDVGLPTLVDGDPRRAAAVRTALRDRVHVVAATDVVIDAIVDHDGWTLGIADDAISTVLERGAEAPRVDLLLLRHVVRAAYEAGPAGVLGAIGYGRPGETAGLSALRCLYCLLERPGASGRELVQAMGMQEAGVSRLLGQLRARGDVRSAGSPGRRKHWSLTESGRARLVAHR